ncbi:MAG: F0F1 ATP synthase subunit B [Parcubacteria group bacterium]|jgi:F-type H+-transporting ATPase subunit b
MEELIKTFHIEVNLLLAQMVNFVIVLLVLYKFAYKPILKTLNDRTKKIEKGLKDSADASQKLEEITEKEKEVLINAKKEAQEIIKKSENEAKKNAESITAEMKEKNAKMLEDAKAMIEEEKKKMLSEIKSEVADLVVMATEKVIAEKLDLNKDKEIIEKSLGNAE